MEINLISDTVTKPTKEMRDYMCQAEVGDDVFGEDPTINALQKKAAEMFGMEDALFCPSGTMTNQIAIKVHTQALDELICEKNSHVYQYETGGYSFNSSIAVKLIDGEFGKLKADQIVGAVNGDFDWLPKSSLVVIENSTNKGGGNYYTIEEIKSIRNICNKLGLKLHLDGARLFNVLVETKESTLEYGKYFDSISICISKGLGAPVGSLLLGSQMLIKQARRFRKVMGGGMRQAGIIAAGCIYALENNIERLKLDNEKAKEIGICLEQCDYVENVRPVKTNIVIFELKDKTGVEFVEHLKSHNIIASPFGPKAVRFVTHMDYTDDMHKELLRKLKAL